MPQDLLHPSRSRELRTHKLKRLLQEPNTYFMDVRCSTCYNISSLFSHAQTRVNCIKCNTNLCEPTGGSCRLAEGCSFRKKKKYSFLFEKAIAEEDVAEVIFFTEGSYDV